MEDPSIGIDVDAIRALSHAWISFGDQIDECRATMNNSVSGISWQGNAAGAMHRLWSGDAGGDAGTIEHSLIAAHDIAYEIGNAINTYADDVEEAIQKIKDE